MNSPACAVLALVLLACAGQQARAQLLGTPGLSTGCDWQLAFDPDVPGLGNTAFPEIHARYWIATLSHALPAGSRLRVEGRFPDARYSALHVHDGHLFVLDALSDNELAPDPGNAPLFLDRTVQDLSAEPGGRYTAFVRINTAIPAQREPNTLYRPPAPLLDPAKRRRTVLAYRTYLPAGGNEGGFDLPRLVLQRPGHSELPLADTPDSAACQAIEDALAGERASLPVSLIPPLIPERQPSFRVFDGAALDTLRLGTGFNPHNAFMAVKTDHAYGDDLLIRGRMPRYTTEDDPAIGVPEVRYYSLCQYGAASGKVVDCLHDAQLARDLNGLYTVVISQDAERPAFLPEDAYGWLPWGPDQVGAALIRELLDHPTYAKSILKSGDTQSGIDRGDLTPEVTYCARSVLQQALAQNLAAAEVFSACRAAPKNASLLSLPLLPLYLPGLLN